MINETRTFLPSQKEYNTFLKRAWDKIWLTNRDKLTLELKSKLKINSKSITLVSQLMASFHYKLHYYYKEIKEKS